MRAALSRVTDSTQRLCSSPAFEYSFADWLALGANATAPTPTLGDLDSLTYNEVACERVQDTFVCVLMRDLTFTA